MSRCFAQGLFCVLAVLAAGMRPVSVDAEEPQPAGVDPVAEAPAAEPKWPATPPREVGADEFRRVMAGALVDKLDHWSLLAGGHWAVARVIDYERKNNWLSLPGVGRHLSRGSAGVVAIDVRSRAFRYLFSPAASRDGHYAYRAEIAQVLPWRREQCVVAVRWLARELDEKGGFRERVLVQPQAQLWRWSMSGGVTSLGLAPRPEEQLESLVNLAQVIDACEGYDFSWRIDDPAETMAISIAERNKQPMTIECRPNAARRLWSFTAVEGAGKLIGIASFYSSPQACVSIRRFSAGDDAQILSEDEVHRQLGNETCLTPVPGGTYPNDRVPLVARNDSDRDEPVYYRYRLCYLDCRTRIVSVAPVTPWTTQLPVPISYFSSLDGKSLFNLQGSPYDQDWQTLYSVDAHGSGLQQLTRLPGLDVLGMTPAGHIVLQLRAYFCVDLWLLEAPLGKTKPKCICTCDEALGPGHAEAVPPGVGGGMF